MALAGRVGKKGICRDNTRTIPWILNPRLCRDYILLFPTNPPVRIGFRVYRVSGFRVWGLAQFHGMAILGLGLQCAERRIMDSGQAVWVRMGPKP